MKVPTKHGLDRKFKSWRKGKSTKSNKRSSLKQQLRGQERLLAKVSSGNNTANNTSTSTSNDDSTKRQELVNRIAALKGEIGQKQQTIEERKNAERAHGQRFLDRQRLTRLEKKVRKEVGAATTSSSDYEFLLYKLALDQVYVAHHPNDVRYMPLYKLGNRIIDQSRHLYRRAITRKRILRDLAATAAATAASEKEAEDDDHRTQSNKDNSNSNKIGGSSSSRVNWISLDQYQRLPKDWTIQDEERIFGGSISRTSSSSHNKDTTTNTSSSKLDDSRFTLQAGHDAVLKAVEQVESQFNDNEENDVESDDDNDSPTVNDDGGGGADGEDDNESDDNSNDDSFRRSDKDNSQLKLNTNQDDSSSSSSSSSDSSIGSVDKNGSGSTLNKTQVGTSAPDDEISSSSSSSSSDSDEEDTPSPPAMTNKISTIELSGPGRKRDNTQPPPLPVESNSIEEVDDFLVDADATRDGQNVFLQTTTTTTTTHGSGFSNVRGNKSRGWETQKQRPGEFKKRRTRW
jgi:hypothetical protein